MTKERSQQIEFIRSEIVGPARPLPGLDGKDRVKPDSQGRFVYPKDLPGMGTPVFWRKAEDMDWQEIIHVRNETPFNRYGAGMLFPAGLRELPVETVASDSSPETADGEGGHESLAEGVLPIGQEDNQDRVGMLEDGEPFAEEMDPSDDFDVTSPDMYRPSTLAISFCLKPNVGELVISLPPRRLFPWQPEADEPFQVNGRYQKSEKTVAVDDKTDIYPAWLRFPATTEKSEVRVAVSGLQSGKIQRHPLPLPDDSPLSLYIEVFPRKLAGKWIITVVLRNDKSAKALESKEAQIGNTLFQAYFQVCLEGANFARYPEGTRPFEQLDKDEQTLALLYEDSATWAIGHGCSAGWDAGPGEVPDCLYADVMPVVELPSMTPDITDSNGNPVKLPMRQLACLPAYDPKHSTWQLLESLLQLYGKWINEQRQAIPSLSRPLQDVAQRHVADCQRCFDRISGGLDILKSDKLARRAFQLANQCMLLQQISTKQLQKRTLRWNGEWVVPCDPENQDLRSPSDIYLGSIQNDIGHWRAFQIAFLLMSLKGLTNEDSVDEREVVDLIWFPTGGGKTEAYLGVAAFYLFHQRLTMSDQDRLGRDGTGVFMRYTLRMLTTQQFQRAASLICAMEYVRTADVLDGNQCLGKTPFSLGLWIGGDGSPNNCKDAKSRLNQFRNGKMEGNPLVLTECPWCRSEIGRLAKDPRKQKKGQQKWADICTAGIVQADGEPVLKCSDDSCRFGGEHGRLPIEVIDERIYRSPPSFFISTADKFAMLAYKPEAGSLFGRLHSKNGAVEQINRPPGLIIQDELHLISGPLGTVYGVYEGMIERLCSVPDERGNVLKPKIVASTATIRGAQEQVRAIYARDKLDIFPSPGLLMKDSFFGCYAIGKNHRLAPGRLYLGIHASTYGSFLTAQVRVFTAALFRTWFFDDNRKDAWWTLLAFYNSLRELGGARTLFDSDIASRLKNYFYRYGCGKTDSRYLNQVVELTSRRSQAELVEMMDRLSKGWEKGSKQVVDACLASNIIEVGVDIDRLSVMAVVGQPKSTAQYIQVTGRVGRRWWERPGLILAMYNPAKSRDRSHFEQFHSYHRRLYERVEPTSATPFSIEAIERAMVGSMFVWARQFHDAETPGGRLSDYKKYLDAAREILVDRCNQVVAENIEQQRVREAIHRVYERLLRKWNRNPQSWQEFPQKRDGEYLMLWPGQIPTESQKLKGEMVLSSMRNVDACAYMQITDLYVHEGDQ